MSNSIHSRTVRKSAIVSGLVSAIVAILFLLVFGGSLGTPSGTQQAETAPAENAQAMASTSPVVGVVEEAKPSVVSVVATKRIPEIERFVQEGPFGIQIPRQRLEGFDRRQVGSGSGFFVSKDGLIVTNRHVVADKQAQYSAVTNDGKTLDLEVVDRDPFLDIAVLQVKNQSQDYPALSFGDSDQLRPGQQVIAIGNALGEFQNSVSAGVVSGLGRSLIAGQASGNPERLEQVIQTDVAINPGNSGGPLLNLAGQVIGVNVAIVQGSENISFALPANAVRESVQSVEKYGEIVRPFLGVRYVSVTEELAQQRDLPSDRGALITGSEDASAVQPNSAADEAGIRAGDILLSFGGEDITEDTSLSELIRQYEVGDTVKITLLRDGDRKTVTAKLQKAPDSL